MKIKLLTLLTILTVSSIAIGAPTTSARVLIEGGGTPAPVTAPAATTTPTNTTPTPTAITTTNNANTTTPAPSRVRDWFSSLSPAISNTINTVVSRVRDWVSSLAPPIGTVLNPLNIFTLPPTPPPTTNQTGGSVTTITNLGSTSTEKAADKSGMATFTVNWSADNVSSWSVTGNDGFSSSGGSTTTGPITRPPGFYRYIITGIGSNGISVSKSADITISGLDRPKPPKPTIDNGDTNITNPTNTTNTGANGGTGVTNQLTACNANISANPNSILPSKTSTLTWDCGQANGCTISDDNPKVADIGAVASRSAYYGGSLNTPIIPSTTKFTLQCPGTIQSSATVGVFNSYIKEVSPQ